MESSQSKRRSLDYQDMWTNGSTPSDLSRNESYASILPSPPMLSPSMYDTEETEFAPSESPDQFASIAAKTTGTSNGSGPDKLKRTPSKRLVGSRETPSRPTLSPSPSRKPSTLPKKAGSVDAKRRTAK
ncbi:hypothetical protein PIB30_000419 [Stylosanthes scabra]|uniref:Uncharacterized protein n=1 Tax=Stylosanthes scabra TaxID=79078 RepID=A0ABU6V4K4_9FABA|nr:hypothetical protein [Stylosanthes scabra]